jgi:pimeloyl-ACP methyl ester carboxylesterase
MKIKYIPIFSMIFFALSNFLSAQAFVVPTGCMPSWIDDINNENNAAAQSGQPAPYAASIPVLGSASFLYTSADGIDSVSTSCLNQWESTRAPVLIGHSLGGVIARRMAQRANTYKYGLLKGYIKGYIATSSPMMGDALANPTWRSSAISNLAVYLKVLATVHLSQAWNLVGIMATIGTSGSLKDTDVAYSARDSLVAQMPEAGQGLFAALGKVDENRSLYKDVDPSSLATDVVVPTLEALMPQDATDIERDWWSDATTYLSAAFASSGNIADLNPSGSFMVDTLNSYQGLLGEASYKRAFLVSKNGDMYKSEVWYTASTLYYYDLASAATFYAIAALAPASAAATLPIAITETACAACVIGLPNVWSTAVSGSASDYTIHDGFVQNNVKFNSSITLKMVPPDFKTGSSIHSMYDISYDLSSFSHIDSGYTKARAATFTGIDGVKRSEAIKDYETKLSAAYLNMIR